MVISFVCLVLSASLVLQHSGFVPREWSAVKCLLYYKAFSHDVTSDMLVSQNNKRAAMLVCRTSPVRVKLFSELRRALSYMYSLFVAAFVNLRLRVKLGSKSQLNESKVGSKYKILVTLLKGDAWYTKSIYALLCCSIVWSLFCYCVRARDDCCLLCDVTRDLLFTWYMVHWPF